MTGGGRRLAAAVAALVLLVGCSGSDARQAEPPSATASPTPDQAAGADAADGFRSTRGYRATPVPVRVEIPRIGVASSLDRLGRAPDGTVEEPSRWAVAGWYTPGTRPGDPGSAVILGHVDSKRGPAVFFRAPRAAPGRHGHYRARRRLLGALRRPADRAVPQGPVPNRRGVLPHPDPALRLVTCGGEFDATVGRYRSNVIVFATMAP
jgi:hypothetical protein